ncbi:phage tail protein [Algibacter mikhailovii]|uniref:phage tail protein n=1 Tax=Algibacter mikhailovii TaxID=425498 RepID=UPI002493ED74|nr:phage tail protein [Algibacter mikhailovii]
MGDALRNFQFTVDFTNNDFNSDRHFQSVEGLHAQITKNISKKAWLSEFDVLILKRAYRPDSNIVAWCMNAINNKILTPENLSINLLNSRFEVVSQWQVVKAIPVGWSLSPLNAEEGQILIETITLKYSYFQVVNSKGKIVSPKKKPFIKKRVKD